MTWTMRVSGSLTGCHDTPSRSSRRRTPWPIVNGETSTSMDSGISDGRQAMATSRCTKSIRPPCTLTPSASPVSSMRTVTVMTLSMATR